MTRYIFLGDTKFEKNLWEGFCDEKKSQLELSFRAYLSCFSKNTKYISFPISSGIELYGVLKGMGLETEEALTSEIVEATKARNFEKFNPIAFEIARNNNLGQTIIPSVYEGKSFGLKQSHYMWLWSKVIRYIPNEMIPLDFFSNGVAEEGVVGFEKKYQLLEDFEKSNGEIKYITYEEYKKENSELFKEDENDFEVISSDNKIITIDEYINSLKNNVVKVRKMGFEGNRLEQALFRLEEIKRVI